MELILFDKYLVRGYEGGFILSKVREGKTPEVIETLKPNSKGVLVATKDYSNFGKETYPTTFGNVLISIRRQELSDSDITTLEQLNDKLEEIKKLEKDIQSKFE